MTLAEGAIPWDLRGDRLDAFRARLVRRETMTAAYNHFRPARPARTGLERQLEGGLWVAEVSFEQARVGNGRAWGALRYRGGTGVADFPILRKNLFR